MNNKDYNDYLTTLFQNCSIQIYLQGRDENIKRDIYKMFNKLSNIYNEGFANDFLKDLGDKYPNINDKVKNYPEMFWKTSLKNDVINYGLVSLVKQHMKESYSSSINDVKNWSRDKQDNYVDTFITNKNLLLTEAKNVALFFAEDKKNIYEIAKVLEPMLKTWINYELFHKKESNLSVETAVKSIIGTMKNNFCENEQLMSTEMERNLNEELIKQIYYLMKTLHSIDIDEKSIKNQESPQIRK